MLVEKIKHRDYEIDYSESRDVWFCQSLTLENVSLKKLKEDINAYELRLNKINRVKVLVKDSYRSAYNNKNKGFEEGVVTSISKEYDHYVAWVSYTDGGYKRREKRGLAGIVFDTPENRKLFEEAMVLDSIAKESRKKADSFFEKIPSVTEDQLRGTPEEAA